MTQGTATRAVPATGAGPLVPAYLKRIGLAEPVEATLAGLRVLHAAHVAAIPFENLDILLGRRISLDLDHLRAKLVERRRGGYCFEQNTLLLAVLRELGFTATPMEARVRAGATAILPRTHMVVVVQLGSDEWLADVGFGGDGPLEPVSMRAADADDYPGAYRVLPEGAQRVLQTRSPSGWVDLYAFLPERVHPVDFEVANWYTSTHPQSRFVLTLTAQRSTRDVRYVLRYPTYSEIRGADVRTREIGRSELLPLLKETFLIDLAAGTTFAVLDGPPAGRAPV
ncbi:MAG TPA: arylamine N-acetyltransferase [Vicinamibacterales bacterium]|nr:arylamine N-acetyltransferase [Vicinamibacterales bacterium]